MNIHLTTPMVFLPDTISSLIYFCYSLTKGLDITICVDLDKVTLLTLVS